MAKNEYGEKLDSNGYAPSILSKSPTCLICGRYRTARHEVFFGPYRDKSKRLGLWANLCPWCHQNGVTAVHTNREADLRLKKWAQKKAMEYYGWPLACPSGRCWAKPAASSTTVLCSGSISTSWPNQSRKTNCFSVK